MSSGQSKELCLCLQALFLFLSVRFQAVYLFVQLPIYHFVCLLPYLSSTSLLWSVCPRLSIFLLTNSFDSLYLIYGEKQMRSRKCNIGHQFKNSWHIIYKLVAIKYSGYNTKRSIPKTEKKCFSHRNKREFSIPFPLFSMPNH